MTKCLCGVFLKSVIQPILIKDKFVMELVTLVTLLHQTIGSEIGKGRILIVIHFEQSYYFYIRLHFFSSAISSHLLLHTVKVKSITLYNFKVSCN